MNIVVLSRSTELYSTSSLVRAIRHRNHYVKVLDHVYCDIVVEQGKSEIYYHGQRIRHVDAIIPRIGTTVTSYGAMVIRQFQNMGTFTTLDPDALIRTRDKITSMQVLVSQGIRVPKSVISNNEMRIPEMIDLVQPMPIIIKLARGTHGVGVIKSNDPKSAESIIETLNRTKQKVILQPFIDEAKGADIRAFVVDGVIVGAMKRQAKEGEFRSNLHRGGSATIIDLSEEEKSVALRATKAMGLHIAGVDMLQTSQGPMVLEVNASPGLEGIETTTHVDIAGKIVQFIEKNYRKR